MSWLLFGQLVYLLGVILWVTTVLVALSKSRSWTITYSAMMARAFSWPLQVLWHVTIGWWW